MNKKALLIIFLTILVDLIGFGIIIPLSPYLAREFGATAFEVGLLMAIYSGMQFLFSPFWGRLSDQYGRRPILLISILGTVGAHFLFYSSGSLWLLFAARGLAGIFSANISTAAAYIADITPEGSRSKNMGLVGAAFGLGFVIGPAIGGVFSGVSENFPALLAAIISLFNFISAFIFLRESLPVENRRVRAKKSRILGIFEKIKKPVIGSLLFTQFLLAFAMACMEASLFLFVQDRFGWGLQKASFGFAYVGICIAITQGYLVRKILPRVGERKLLLVGLVVFSVGMGLIGSSHLIFLLAIATTFLAVGHGFAYPSLSGSLSLLTAATEQGEIMGVSQSLAALARILGPPLGGYVYAKFAIGMPFWLSCGMGFAAFAIIWTVRSNIPHAGKEQYSHAGKA